MSASLGKLKTFLTKNADTDRRSNNEMIDGGRRAGENENPYLSARRTWNDHMGSIASSRNMWQILTLLSLMIVLAAVGGIIYIGSQSKFVPYVVQVDKLGEAVAVSRADIAAPVDKRVIHATLAEFITNLRTVTPDIALQRRAIFRSVAMISQDDPANVKARDWFGNESATPFERAATQTASIEIISVIPQSEETWQVDWRETLYDRQGQLIEQPFGMRALLNVYVVPPTAKTTEKQIRNNPLGIYVRDFSWSRKD